MSRRFHIYNEDAINEDETWEDLSQYQWQTYDDGAWHDLESPSFYYDGDSQQWRPLSVEYWTPWCENTLSFHGSSSSGLGGNMGIAPDFRSTDTITSTSSTQLFPPLRPLELRTGEGYYAWKTPGQDKVYLRFYIRTSVNQNDYRRRLISFYKDSVSGTTRKASVVLWVRGTGTPSGSNNLSFVVDDQFVEYAPGETVGTAPDSLPSEQWCRVEMLVHRMGIVHMKIYDDPHSHVPSEDAYFNVAEYADGINFPVFNIVDIAERSYLGGTNKQPTRLQHFAISDKGWIGPVETPSITLGNQQTNIVVSDSASAPLASSTMNADEYVILSCLYTDSASSDSFPSITPPSGFKRLGAEYVGGTGSDHRTVLLIFGKYFSSTDTNSKQLSVEPGRAGRWIVEQRHYLGVHPDHPVSEAWVGESNIVSSNLHTKLRPSSVNETERGDLAFYAGILKTNAGMADAMSGWFDRAVSNPVVRSYGGGVSSSNHSNGRRSAIMTDDQWLYSMSSHPISGIKITKTQATTDAIGRVVLRPNKVLDFTPVEIPEYSTPATIPAPDLGGGGGEPEPDPEFQTFTTTWDSTWRATFDDFGKRSTNVLYQGRYSSSRGRAHSYVGFDYNDIQNELEGATIDKLEVFLNNQHFYYSTGGPAVIGTHTLTSEPSSTPSGHHYSRTTPSFNYDEQKWVTGTGAMSESFKDGSARGITLGHPNSGSLSDYGYFAGGTSTSVRLRITYTKLVG